MTDVAIASTDDLSGSQLTAIRRLLDAAFDGNFDDHDWQHALGGHHATVTESGALVAHGSVVVRRLWIGDSERDVGYVEAVAARPDVQGRGFGTLAMEALGELIDAQRQLGVLSTGEWRFYERLGWQRWAGPTFVRRHDGTLTRTPDEDDGVMVLAPTGGAEVDLGATIACAERHGDDW